MEYLVDLESLIKDFSPHLNERTRRLFAGSLAKAMPYGGISAVSL
jgi:hypothetical protein